MVGVSNRNVLDIIFTKTSQEAKVHQAPNSAFLNAAEALQALSLLDEPTQAKFHGALATLTNGQTDLSKVTLDQFQVAFAKVADRSAVHVYCDPETPEPGTR